jgi:hypothetical protein
MRLIIAGWFTENSNAQLVRSRGGVFFEFEDDPSKVELPPPPLDF